jgi:tetratricopeptide (TPR) repeat protein
MPPDRRFEWLLINQKFGRLNGLLERIEEWLGSDPDKPVMARLKLLTLKVKSQLHRFDAVIAQADSVAEALKRTDQRHLAAQAYHRGALALASLGQPQEAAAYFGRALEAGKVTRNHHQMNTTRFLWAISAAFRDVTMPSEWNEPVDVAVAAGHEYARAAVSPLLWQASKLKSAVHTLIVEGSIMMKDPSTRSAGKVRLLAARQLVRGTGGAPQSEGYAEHLAMEVPADRALVEAAMSRDGSSEPFNRMLEDELLLWVAKPALDAIATPLGRPWHSLRAALREVDRAIS